MSLCLISSMVSETFTPITPIHVQYCTILENLFSVTTTMETKKTLGNQALEYCGRSLWIVVRNGVLFWYKHRLSIYGEFNYKDKTVLITSYLYNDNPYTGETASLYWGATHPKHRTQPSPIYLQTLRKLWSFHSGTKKRFKCVFSTHETLSIAWNWVILLVNVNFYLCRLRPEMKQERR